MKIKSYYARAFSAAECLWEELEEPEINATEFEDLFSKAPAKKKSSPEKHAKAKKTREVNRSNER